MSSYSPIISVVIPVWREEKRIDGALNDLFKVIGDFPCELILVDGDSRGATLEVVKRRSPHLLGIPFHCRLSPKGRANQMNCGAEKTIAPILIFLHADTRLPLGALSLIVESLNQSPEVVGGAFDLDIDSSSWLLKVIARVSSWRSRITRIPYGDQAIFLRREAFEAVGGFASVPLMEDVILMRAIKRRGMKIRFLDAKVVTSPRRWEKEGVIRCTLRNWMLIVLFFLGVSPQALARFYR